MTLARIDNKIINLSLITVVDEIDGRLLLQFQGASRASITMDMESFVRVLHAHGIRLADPEHIQAMAEGRPVKEIDYV